MKISFLIPFLFVLISTLSSLGMAAPKFTAKDRAVDKTGKASFNLNEVPTEDRGALVRMVTFTLLQRSASNLEAFFHYRDENALRELIEPWGTEEQLELKAELMSVTEKPSIRVEGSDLYVILKEEKIALRLEDPFQGVFSINGQRIKIDPLSKYRHFKEKFDKLAEVAHIQNPLLNAMIPSANAGVISAATKAALAALRASAGATGGIVKKEAVPEAKRISSAFSKKTSRTAQARSAKQPPPAPTPLPTEEGWRFWFGRSTKEQIRNVAVFACIGFGTKWRHEPSEGERRLPDPECVKSFTVDPVKKGLCAVGAISKSCISTVGELAAEIKDVDNLPPIPVPDLATSGRCNERPDGFYKNLKVNLYDPKKAKDMSKTKPNAPIPPPVGTINLHLEYKKNPTDPKSLIVKSITQEIRLDSSNENNLPANRSALNVNSVWVYDGDDWTINLYRPSQERSEAKAMYLGSPTPFRTIKCVAKSLSDECKLLDENLKSTLGAQKHCIIENANQKIDQIKAENKAGIN